MTIAPQKLENDLLILVSQIENHLASFPNIYKKPEQIKLTYI